jgi:hypothetical protein
LGNLGLLNSHCSNGYRGRVLGRFGCSGLENGRAAAHIAQMNNPKKEDIDRQGGWLFQLKTPPNLTRLFDV